MKKITLKDAKELLRAYALTINKKDDEYRVNYLGGKEETAYYTDDIEDAIATGKMMAERKNIASILLN